MRRRTLPLVTLALAAACVPPGGGSPPGASAPSAPSARFPDPVLRVGFVSPSAEAAAARLVGSARELLDAGDYAGALDAATEVVDAYPTAPVSGEALWLRARAAGASGLPDVAVTEAERYARLLDPRDPRLAGVRLLQAELLDAAGRRSDALRRILVLPPGAGPGSRDAVLDRVRLLASALSHEALGEVLRDTPLGQPLAAPVMVAYAEGLRETGDREGAERYARAAVAAGAAGSDREAAQRLLEDEPVRAAGPAPAPDPTGTAAPATLGAVLPASGSPRLQEYARLIEEGVRVAVEEAGAFPLELLVRDDQGLALEAEGAVRALEGSGSLGLVGPLQDQALAAAAAARSRPLPLVSPTAVELPVGAPGVYSLGAPDPLAARALAEYALGAGLRRVAIVHDPGQVSTFLARTFREVLEAGGGQVVRTITYTAGATYFQEPLTAVRSVRPDAVFFPVPAEDVPLLAPQVTFFGLDTLGIRILAGPDWTSEDVVRQVDSRHMNGVVAATPEPPDGNLPGLDRFVDGYERLYRRTLRSPFPALGYDAAALLLAALETGARTPEAVVRALEDVRDLEGATGRLSVQDGRIVREHHLVCIQDGALVAVPAGVRSQLVLTRPEEPGAAVDGPPVVVLCPGVEPPTPGPGPLP